MDYNYIVILDFHLKILTLGFIKFIIRLILVTVTKYHSIKNHHIFSHSQPQLLNVINFILAKYK